MPENTSLSAKQLRLIAALVAGSSIVNAARACKINECTAHRWLKQPLFAATLAAAKQEAFNEALDILKTGVKAALVTLADGMKAESESVRVRAAAIWLEQAISQHKIREIEAQFDELERLIKASGLVR